MDYRRLTDEETVKALECCESREGCIGSDCPLYNGEYTDCVKTVIDLIHRQKQEIELLSKVIGSSKHKTKILELQKEIERLTWTSNLQRDGTRLYERRCEEQKAEIERLKEEIERQKDAKFRAVLDKYELRKMNVELQKQMDESKKEPEREKKWIDFAVRQAVKDTEKDTAKEIYDEIDKSDILVVQTQEYGEIEVIPIERLKEIVKSKGKVVEVHAEKGEELLKEIPCNVGDTVYEANTKNCQVYCHTVYKIEIRECLIVYWTDGKGSKDYGYFGEDTFLTKAEAKKRLNEA